MLLTAAESKWMASQVTALSQESGLGSCPRLCSQLTWNFVRYLPVYLFIFCSFVLMLVYWTPVQLLLCLSPMLGCSGITFVAPATQVHRFISTAWSSLWCCRLPSDYCFSRARQIVLCSLFLFAKEIVWFLLGFSLCCFTSKYLEVSHLSSCYYLLFTMICRHSSCDFSSFQFAKVCFRTVFLVIVQSVVDKSMYSAVVGWGVR